MTFLNVSLVAGALAGLIPLVIHLLSRARFRMVDWGAMHLLESAIEVNARRIQWHSWLLLLTRCLIPVALAICLAQPILTAWISPHNQGRTHVAWLVDDSFSMQAATSATSEGEGTQSALEVGQSTIRETILGLGAEATHSIIAMGGTPENLTGSGGVDWRTAQGFLNSIRGDAGPCRILDAFSAAASEIVQASHPRRLIAVVSDFQQSQWDNIEENTWLTIGERFRAMAIPPQLVFIPIPVQNQSNVGVMTESNDITVVGTGQSIDITATVHNYGSNPIAKLPVSIFADQNELATKSLDLPGQSASQVSIVCQFDSPGSHLITIKITDPSSIRSDNEAHVPIQAVDKIDVVILADDASHSANSGNSNMPAGAGGTIEENYLRFSLAPFASGQSSGRDLVRVRELSPSSFVAPLPNPTNAILLGDFSSPHSELANLLQQYVLQGGTLMIFAGQAPQIGWYNDHLGSKKNMLPFRYPDQWTNSKNSESGHRIIRQIYDHPALGFFNNRENGDLTSVEFYRWFALQTASDLQSVNEKPVDPAVRDSERTAQSPTVLVSLENGDPLIAELKYGKGTIIQFACDLNERSSNLTSRPVFLPLIQQLVLASTLTSARARSVPAGQEFSIRLSELVEHQNRGSVGQADQRAAVRKELRSAVMVTPAGFRQELAAVGNRFEERVKYAQTRVPGVYKLELSDQSREPPTVVHFVATSSADESELNSLPSDNIQKIAEWMGARVVASADGFLAAERQHQTGKQIWLQAFALVLLLLFSEMLLQQRVGRTSV